MDWYHQRQVPIDVLAEILVRLPVKSLLRFQCVSKTWRSLILDPSFVKSHRLRSQQKPLFLIVNDWWMQNDTFTIYSLTDKAMLGECFNSPEETLVEYFKSPDISCDAVMITSSPDLLLFRQDIRGIRSGCFFLLNPSTGERLILPESHNFKGCCSFGLDYVPSLGRFKVARFFPGAKAKARTGCEVLVVGVDRSWRPTEDSPLTVNCCTHGAPLLNGVIHMLSSFLDQGIAAFDLRREIWRVIQLPPGFCFRGNSWVPQEQTDLRELKGSLYLSRFTLMKLETWVLKDYENGNWTMQYNIDILQLWRMCWYDIECHTKVYPLMIKDDGKILMAVSTTKGVFHYDTEKKVFTVLGYIPEPFVYAENYLPLT